MSADDCVFCQIIAGTRPATDFRDHGSVVSFVPLDPVTDGHRLFVPRRHVATAADNPLTAGLVAAEAARAGADLGGDFNLIVNNGPDASQTVPHLHWHVVPRRAGDGLALPWTGQKRSAPTHLDGEQQ